MSDSTHIEWTDTTWNILSGCTRVSAGCDHCYIERTPPFRMAHRKFDGDGPGSTTGVQLHPDRLAQPLRWRKPRKVFVNSLADLFHDDVPDNYIGSVFDMMGSTPRHTYQILTKRPARMRSLLTKWAEQANDRPHAGASFRRDDMIWSEPEVWPLPNVWLGVSVESQQWADIRPDALRATPAAVRFLSVEPLLGPVTVDLTGIDWVICGGESGPGARPMNPDWARSLRDQCRSAGVPFLFKQWGAHVTHSQMPEATALDWDAKYGSEVWHESVQWRVGKKAAGRDLDGRTWDEYPAVAR